MMMSDKVKPLPYNLKEYEIFMKLLSKIALNDKDRNLCDVYFDLQKRAIYGNGYYNTDEKIDREMWNLGTGEKHI